MISGPPLILAVESATSVCSVALWQEGAVLAEIRPSGRGQSEILVPAIAEAVSILRRDHWLDWPDITALAVTVGPGSFTGLRIGLAAVRGLALARGLPVIGVTTADLFASQLPGRPVLVAIDSKRDDLFVQSFDEEGNPIGDLRAVTPETALVGQRGSLIIVGDAATRFEGLRPGLEIRPLQAEAAALAPLAWRRFGQGRALTPTPLYLRPPDATPVKPV